MLGMQMMLRSFGLDPETFGNQISEFITRIETNIKVLVEKQQEIDARLSRMEDQLDMLNTSVHLIYQGIDSEFRPAGPVSDGQIPFDFLPPINGEQHG